MQNSKFNEKHRLTRVKEELWKENLYSAPDFISVTEKFLKDNFRGLYALDITLSEYRYIRLTEEYVIYFFKHLIYDIHGDELLFVNLSCNIEDFCIEVWLKEGLTFNRHLRQKLTELATRGGFEVSLIDKRLAIKKTALTPVAVPVYARPIEGSILETKYYDIFFGEN